MKKFLRLILLPVVAVCMFVSAFSVISGTNTGTETTMGGIVTRQTEQFILQNFGEAESAEELANDLLTFALKNFVYDERYMDYPQTADTNRFIFQHDFHGVCLDFAAFVKSTFQVICRHKGWDNVGCNVAIGLDIFGKKGHAANYITVKAPDGSARIYALDTTWDLDRSRLRAPLQRLRSFVTVPTATEIPDTIRSVFLEYYRFSACIIT